MTRAALRLGYVCDRQRSYGQVGTVPSASILTSLASAGNVTGWKVDAHASQFEQPYVLVEGLHLFALYKPPFWEVSVDSTTRTAAVTAFDEDDATTEDEMPPEEGRQKLKMQIWIQQHLASHYPICKDAIAGFGLMHRLDVQTSGVLLCAKSYAGAYWMRMQ